MRIAKDRRPAVLLLGRLATLARHSRVVTEATRRGYVPLAVVGFLEDANQLARRLADPAHPLGGFVDAVSVPDPSVDSVLAQAGPLLAHYDLRAVLSTGEPFLEPAGVLAALLDLPGPGWSASRVCRNKLLQRMRLPQLAPPWAIARSGQGPGFPAVVKPVGRFQSSGVRLVRSAEELELALDAFPASETVLVERRVVGAEYSVEALVQNSHMLWSGVTHKETNEATGCFFTEVAHTSPAADLSAAEEAALLATNADLISRIDMRDGMTHAEFRLTDGEPILMEVAARVPGDGITLMWELATGQPIEPVLLDLALGVPTSYPQPRRRVRHMYLEHPHGRLCNVCASVGDDRIAWIARDHRWPEPEPAVADAPAGCCAVLVSRLPGDLLGDQGDSTQRCVSVMVDAPLDERITDVAEKFAAEISIVTE